MLIEVAALRHAIAGRDVLRLDDLGVEEGRHTLVLGPSGSGKTTLLAVLAGMLPPTVGRVVVDGQDLVALAPAKRDGWRARNVGFVFQALHLVEALDLRRNLELAAFCAGAPSDPRRLADLLARVGLADRAGARPSELSQGEAQRIAIARALVNRPRLILADEPTSALDDRTARLVGELLVAQADASGATLVIATHDHRLAALVDARISLRSPR